MEKDRQQILKDRQQIIREIRKRESQTYNEEGQTIRKQIIPRCKSCECNWENVCKAHCFWNVPENFKRDEPVKDEDNVCIYWAPSYDAYTEGSRKAGYLR